MECRHGAAQEDKADVMCVGIVLAPRHEPHPLMGQFEKLLVTGPKIGGEKQSDPESAEPVAMTPCRSVVAGGTPRRHRLPVAGGIGDVRKLDAESGLVLQALPSQQVERGL